MNETRHVTPAYAVFCGAASGHDPRFATAATALGQALVRHGRHLVYGGGKVGLMGTIADSVLAAGGNVTGVIPRALVDRELAHRGLTRLEIVPDMHVRKERMAAESDGFIAMPGGAGTLEELFEAWTWAQLGYHHKPCAIFNVDGYFDALLAFLDHSVSAGFLREPYRDMLIVERDPDVLLEKMAAYLPPADKWR